MLVNLELLKRDKAILDGEIADLTKVITGMGRLPSHRSARTQLKTWRARATGQRHALIQKIAKYETQIEFEQIVNAVDLTDDERERFRALLKKLQAAPVSR